MNIQDLPLNLQKEWNHIDMYYSKKTKLERWDDFKKDYENFESLSIKEFLTISDKTFELWKIWRYENGYTINFINYYNSKDNNMCRCYIRDKPNDRCDHSIKKYTFSEVWASFKDYLDYDNHETKLALKEMELLSARMFREWCYKLGIEEEDNYYGSSENKSFVTLWTEFKVIWKITPEDYKEDEFNKALSYINETYICEDFFEHLEDSNYHSFDDYSIREQYEICMDFRKDN